MPEPQPASAQPTRTGGRGATGGVIPGDYALSVGDPRRVTPRGWRWVPLTDFARLESGHTPSRRKPEYWDGDVAWIGIKDATENNGRVIHDTHQHASSAGIANSSARILPEYTVCLSRTASVGYVVVMGRPMATSQDFVNWACADGLNWRWLKYVLQSEKAALLRFASGTTHQTIYFPEVKAFHVLLPPESEQTRICNVLSALDNKIESNARLAPLLEETAAAVFHGAFVEMAGRTGLTESEVGRIPASWQVGRLSDLAKTVRGISYRSADFQPSDVMLVGLKAIKRGGGYVSRGLREYVGPYRKEHMLRRGDILVAHTDLTQAADVLGAAARVPEWETHATRVPSLDLGIVRPATSTVTPEFLFGVLGTAAFRAHARAHASGTTVLHLPRAAVGDFRLGIPPSDEIGRYTEKVRPMLLLADAVASESRTLAELRDAVLPKLVSGEVRVKDVEKAVEGG